LLIRSPADASRPLLPSFFSYCYGHPRDLHSFLHDALPISGIGEAGAETHVAAWIMRDRGALIAEPRHVVIVKPDAVRDRELRPRSEEHTSELQSPYELVCRLLLEKKKTTSP